MIILNTVLSHTRQDTRQRIHIRAATRPSATYSYTTPRLRTNHRPRKAAFRAASAPSGSSRETRRPAAVASRRGTSGGGAPGTMLSRSAEKVSAASSGGRWRGALARVRAETGQVIERPSSFDATAAVGEESGMLQARPLPEAARCRPAVSGRGGLAAAVAALGGCGPVTGLATARFRGESAFL